MTSPSDVRHSPFSLPRVLLWVAILCMTVSGLVQLRSVARLNPASRPDLYSPWMGARAVLHGIDPYTPAMTAQIQKDIYGHVLLPAETWDRQAFVYPAYIAFLLGPFTVLPWKLVSPLFAVLAPLAVGAGVWSWMCFCGTRFGPLTSATVVATVVASWPALWGCYQRQPSLFVIAAIAVALLLFRQGHDVSAGTLLALATVKPQLMVLVAVWLLTIAVAHRRWRFVGMFVLTMLILIGGALLLIPGWIPQWVHAGAAYAHYPAKIPLLVFLFGRYAGFALLLAAVLLVGVKLWNAGLPAPNGPDFPRTAALVLTLTICAMPQNPWLVFNDLLLIPGILVLLGRSSDSSVARLLTAVASLAIALALLATPLCTLLAIHLGPSLNVAMPAFLLNYLLPIPVLAALLTVGRIPADRAAANTNSPLHARPAWL
ncbi:MAG: glycosyltransferase family 87 protein [Acidobacteriaceae bacterium]